MKSIFCILFSLFAFVGGFTQNFAPKKFYLVDSLDLASLSKVDCQLIDSCLTFYYKAKEDTTKINAINIIIEESLDDNVSVKYNNFIYSFVKQKLKTQPSKSIALHLKATLAMCLNDIGYTFNTQGNVPKAIAYYNKSLNIFIEIGNKQGVASSLNNIGFTYDNQGDIATALEYYHKSLKVFEEIGNKRGEASSLNNIGRIYHGQENYKNALAYFQKALKIREEIGDKYGIAISLKNVGSIYEQQGNLTNALANYQKTYKIVEEIKDNEGLSVSLNAIGGVYEKQGNIPVALSYYYKSLKISEESNDNYGIAISLNYIGMIELKENHLNSAKANGVRSLAVAQEIGSPADIKDAAHLLSQVYKKQGKGIEALEMYQLFVQMKDSINNETTQKAGAQQQAKYEYEKQKAIDDAENEKLVVIEKEAKAKQKVITYATAGGLGLVAIFLIFVVSRLQVTKKQKHIIEQQKEIVEEKHKEITDSINYAERIQRSFLATTEMLDQHLKDYFVFFRPKDVVSGDFYWVGELNNGNFAFSVADSTGHGVPGAIMSILNISSLEKSIEKETAPDQILNKTRKIIIERLKKDGSSEGGKDGMDCSLLVLNQDRTQLSFAAANNPVFILRPTVIASEERTKQSHSNEQIASLPTVVRNDDGEEKIVHNDGYELIEFKPDKMPVGKHDNDTQIFTLHTALLQKGDVIYALTDGFPDQFGGDKGKKYMIKNLKELLLQIAHLPMLEQEHKLADEFTNWKGSNGQVDDVCIIGVRI